LRSPTAGTGWRDEEDRCHEHRCQGRRRRVSRRRVSTCGSKGAKNVRALATLRNAGPGAHRTSAAAARRSPSICSRQRPLFSAAKGPVVSCPHAAPRACLAGTGLTAVHFASVLVTRAPMRLSARERCPAPAPASTCGARQHVHVSVRASERASVRACVCASERTYAHGAEDRAWTCVRSTDRARAHWPRQIHRGACPRGRP